MTLSKGLRFKVLTRDGFTCRYCGRRAPDVVLHVDHVHPHSKGGRDTMDNLVSACRDCNHAKGARLLSDQALAAIGATRAPRLGEDLTVPPDMCRACRPDDLTLYLGFGLRQRNQRTVVAHYACTRGHVWRTAWGSAALMSPGEAAKQAAEWNDAQPAAVGA